MSTTTLVDNPSARIADHLAKTVGRRRYDMWFDHSAHFDYDDQERTLAVAVPNRFIAERIGRDFHDQICAAARDAVGEAIDIDVRIDPTRFAAVRPPAASNHTPVDQDTRERLRLREMPGQTQRRAGQGGDRTGALRHTLEQFIVGPSNELAYRAASGIALEQPVANPVFVHGGCGLGKTHLIQGACRALLERNPAARVAYFTGEQFTNQYITAVRSNGLEAFRKRIRRLDMLAVDDVHFIADKEKTQREFLHCFDAIDLAGARLILASDCHPKLIKKFSEALVSRCVRGLVVQVHSPDLQTRKALVRALARRRDMVLLDSVVDALAERATGSVREIEGTLTKLHALASLTRNPNTQRDDGHGRLTQPVGHALLDRLLDDPAMASRSRPVRFDTILKTVCQRLDVPAARVTGSSRHKHVVLARSLVIHLTRQLTAMSYPEIAAAFGKKNHSTIITADKRVKQSLADASRLMLNDGRDTTLSALLDELRAELTRA